MTRRLLPLLLLPVITVARLHAQSDSAFDAVARRGIDEVYNLEFERADSTFDTLKQINPRHPAGLFFHSMVEWWRIMIDIDNDAHDKEFFDGLDRVIALCDSILDKNPNDVTALFFKGGAIGFKGRLKFHRDDYFAAANAGRKALPLIQQVAELAPDNSDVLLGTGMYNYYADVIPEEYPFAKPLLLFIPPGDKKKGLQELTQAAEKGKFASVEATYFLLQTYYFYEKDYPKALDLATELTGKYPNNMLFQKYLGRCYVVLGDWSHVHEVFSDIVARTKRNQRGYNASAEREAEYYLGMCAMVRRDYDEALKQFYRCDETSRGLDKQGASGFMVMANLKVGMMYDLQGKRELAIQQYRKVLGMKEYVDSYAQAEQYLKKPFMQ